MDVVGNVESVIGDLPMFETPDTTVDDKVEFQGNIFFGGIW